MWYWYFYWNKCSPSISTCTERWCNYQNPSRNITAHFKGLIKQHKKASFVSSIQIALIWFAEESADVCWLRTICFYLTISVQMKCASISSTPQWTWRWTCTHHARLSWASGEFTWALSRLSWSWSRRLERVQVAYKEVFNWIIETSNCGCNRVDYL